MANKLTAQRIAAVMRKAGLSAYKPPHGAYTSVRGKTLYDVSAEEGYKCSNQYDSVRVDFVCTRSSWTDDQERLRHAKQILIDAGYAVSEYTHSNRIVCLDVRTTDKGEQA
jgi:hypothetical protein